MKLKSCCFPVIAAGALLLASCANTPAGGGAVASADEYEYVTPLGSNIPVRVKKGQKAETASPTAAISGDQAANAVHGGGGQMTPIPGQKP